MKSVKINHSNVVKAFLFDKEDITNKFWWCNDIYKRRFFSRKKYLYLNAGFVWKQIAKCPEDVEYLEYLGHTCKYSIDDLINGNHDFPYEIEVDVELPRSFSRIYSKPYVKVEFVDGTMNCFSFDSYDEAKQFYENLFCCPVTYVYKNK